MKKTSASLVFVKVLDFKILFPELKYPAQPELLGLLIITILMII
jgi:hypothetical protein